MGSGNGETDMFGPNYLLDRDVVLVTLNYRLGPLGITRWFLVLKSNLLRQVLSCHFRFSQH